MEFRQNHTLVFSSEIFEQIIREHLLDFHIPRSLFGMLLARLPQNVHDSAEQFCQLFATDWRSDGDATHGDLLGRPALKLLDKGGKVEALPQITEKGIAFCKQSKKAARSFSLSKPRMVRLAFGIGQESDLHKPSLVDFLLC